MKLLNLGSGELSSILTSQSSSKTSRESLIKQFRGITNATQNDASRILKQHGYRLEASVDAFYNDEIALTNASKGSNGSDKKAEKESREKLGALFDKYKGELITQGQSDYFISLLMHLLVLIQTRMVMTLQLMGRWNYVKTLTFLQRMLSCYPCPSTFDHHHWVHFKEHPILKVGGR